MDWSMVGWWATLVLALLCAGVLWLVRSARENYERVEPLIAPAVRALNERGVEPTSYQILCEIAPGVDERLGIGVGTLHRALDRLVEDGVLTVRRIPHEPADGHDLSYRYVYRWRALGLAAGDGEGTP